MPKQIWPFAGILAALFLGAVALLQLRESARARSDAESQADAARQLADALSQTNQMLDAELSLARAQAAELAEQVQQATSDRSQLEQQMRSELDSKNITISELQGRLTIDILDRILFDSGESELKPEGQQVLLKLAELLQQNTNRQVQVVGHTDNVPIHVSTRGGYTDNWSLSAGRATAAVRFLQEKAGVDPRRLAAVGFGEFRPIAENTSAEGRARNRRIAVVILPEEIAPTDQPRTKPASTTTPAPSPESDTADFPE
jgi:chemotaxis protein MotB